MKWILLRWMLVALMLFGLLLAGADGPLFPLANLAGLSLVVVGYVLIRRDPDYSTLREEIG